MKSLVEEALSRSSSPPPPAAAPPVARGGSLDAELEELLQSLKTKITIIGCGGGGTNTIQRIAEEGITGAELYATNTDAQHLLSIKVPNKILLGRRRTKGLGAGSQPIVGEEAAKEAEDEIKAAIEGSHIVFITCGLGGGTGTGSAGVVARIAKECGALTIAFATLPFSGEGRSRMENAMWGLERLRKFADTVITIPNDKLLELAPRLPLNLAFKMADELLMRSIKGMTEIITKPGLVNLDFNDIRTIMKGAGVAMIGMGESDAIGEDRALEAIEEAINSPLLEVDISEATGVLVNVVGGADMTIAEAERVAEVVQSRVSPKARIIWGAGVDPSLDHILKVMIIVTGVRSKQIIGAEHTLVHAQGSIDVIQ